MAHLMSPARFSRLRLKLRMAKVALWDRGPQRMDPATTAAKLTQSPNNLALRCRADISSPGWSRLIMSARLRYVVDRPVVVHSPWLVKLNWNQARLLSLWKAAFFC